MIGQIAIPDDVVDAVRRHGEHCAPREACGLVVRDEAGALQYFACDNRAERNEHFVLSPEDWLKAEKIGDIVAIAHTHYGVPPEPSQADRVACEASGLPWLIVNVPAGTHIVFGPEGYLAPYLEREFAHGVLDCYTLICDWYRRELGIALPDRHNFGWMDEWWLHQRRLYEDNYDAHGFVRVDTPQRHDVVLMAIGAQTANHAAIWLGDGTILHHVMHRLSTRDPYGGLWRKATRMFLRHKDVM